MDLLTPQPRIDPQVSARIAAWARELFAVPEDGTVRVTELRCTEPGCPPLETVVLVVPGPGKTFQRKVHKPAANVTRADLADAHA